MKEDVDCVVEAIEDHHMAGRTVGGQIGSYQLQVDGQVVPPIRQVLCLLLDTLVKLRFRDLTHGVVDVDENLVENFGQTAHLHEA